jgi:hypothetical protein
MDDLERLFRHLVEVLTTNHPNRLGAAFQVSELYQSILPYRKYKKQLGFEWKEDYGMAVLRLLAGEADYVTVEPAEVREQLILEARATNPNPGAFREFAAARVKLNGTALRSVQAASRSFAPPSAPPADNPALKPEQWAQFAPPADATIESIAKPPVFEAVDHTPTDVPSPLDPEAATLVPKPVEPTPAAPVCPNCSSSLPTHRSVQYCPFCGCQLAPVPCPVCGDEIEVGWLFCATCGRGGTDG